MPKLLLNLVFTILTACQVSGYNGAQEKNTETPYNVVFLMDGTENKDSKIYFSGMRDTVLAMVDNVHQCLHRAKVGIIEYSDMPDVKLELDNNIGKDEIKKLIPKIYPSNSTNRNIHTALFEGRTLLEQVPDGNNTIIVFMFGEPSDWDEMLEEVSLLRSEDVRVFAAVMESTPTINKERIIKLLGGEGNVWFHLPGILLNFMRTKFCVN